MSNNSTFDHARRLGVGADLTDGHDRFIVSDYSPATGQVYGWRLSSRGNRGAYMLLPTDLVRDEPGLGDIPRGGMS